jgi:rhodanese-related sulfurtransferase
MNRLIDRKKLFKVVIVVAILAILTYYTWTQLRTNYNDVTIEQANELIENPSLVILDVRTELEFNSEHIEGAINIPVDALQLRLSELNPNNIILVYCRTGNRSSRAAKILADNGFSNV